MSPHTGSARADAPAAPAGDWRGVGQAALSAACNKLQAQLDHLSALVAPGADSQLHQIGAAAPCVLWLVERANGAVLYLSPAYEHIWGDGRETVLANPAEWMHSIFAADVPIVLEAIKRLLQVGSATADFRIARRDGGTRWVHATGKTICDESGAVVRLAGVAEDVTEARTMAEELRSAREQADAANRTKSEFLANMSHEIRTPLTAILGYADLLAEDASRALSAEQRNSYLAAMRRSGEHLLALLNEILDLSRVEAGRLEVDRAPTDIGQTLADVAALTKVRAAERGLEFELVYETPLPPAVITDPLRVRQILVNLLGNATKFTEQGLVRLVARYRWDAGMLEFDVVDTGIGIDPQRIATLFEPFQQGDASTARRHGGVGLGLAISRRLAELLGGELVLLDSSPEFGTEFRVRIPAAVSQATDAQSGESTGPAVRSQLAEAADALSGLRILYADDGADNQKLTRVLLERAGATVHTVSNGSEAVEAALGAQASGAPFDAVLMDMQMPVMDGYEATNTLRTRGFRGPVIAFTAHAMASDRARCLAAGCDEYITKPIDRTALIEALRSTVDQFRGSAQ